MFRTEHRSKNKLMQHQRDLIKVMLTTIKVAIIQKKLAKLCFQRHFFDSLFGSHSLHKRFQSETIGLLFSLSCFFGTE